MSSTSVTPPNRPVVSDAMLMRLRDTAAGYSNFVDVILDTPGIDGEYGGVDGRDTLMEILRSLIILTGSEEDAVDWLFNSRGYEVATKEDICSTMVGGDYWTLAAIQEWLKVIEKYQALCPELIDAVFRSGARPGDV